MNYNVITEIEHSYGLGEKHNRLFETLVFFDQLCRDNNLKYSLHGGTLLGAVRSNDFIPWDDDADVSMARDDFETLKRICEKKEEKTYYIKTNRLWTSMFTRKSDVDGNEYTIDVFVYDGISSNKILQKIKILIIHLLQGMCNSEIVIDFKKYSFGYKVLVYMTRVLGKIFSISFKRRLMDWVGKKVFTGTEEYVHRTNDSFVGINCIQHGSVIKEYQDILFRNHKLMISKEYVSILKVSYGENYLTPPPECERVPKHVQKSKEV